MLLAMSLSWEELGWAPNSRLFAQIPFQFPPPRLHLLCSHHHGQLAAVTAEGTCPSPREHPLVSMAPVSLHCGFCSLCPSSPSLSSALPLSFRLQVATCVFLGSG